MLSWGARCAILLAHTRKVTRPAPLANSVLCVRGTVLALRASLAFALAGTAATIEELAIAAAPVECACLATCLARVVLEVPGCAKRALHGALFMCERAGEAV